jgi:CRP-like cAMP-binding protein
MKNRLLIRLGSLSPMEADEQLVLEQLLRTQRSVKAKGIVCYAGQTADWFPVIVSGWAARCQTLANGARQITGILLPGDIAFSSRQATALAGEEIIALSSCTLAYLTKRDLYDAIARRPGIAKALRAYAAMEHAITVTWLVSLGRRDAFERIGHLLCELHYRLRLVDLAPFNSFALPFTQNDFADALGLSPVHVNRQFQKLREDRLIELKAKHIEILDLPALKGSVAFDPGYLAPAIERPGRTETGRSVVPHDTRQPFNDLN